MTNSATRPRRLFAGVLAAAMGLAVTPILGLTGTAAAADNPPPVAEPIGTGHVCEGAPNQEPFADVTSADPSYDEIVCLFQADITQGKNTTPPTYAPNGTLTRREMALFLKRLADTADANEVDDNVAALPAYDGTEDYSDTSAESAAVKEAIGQLSQAEIALGFTDGTYRPNTTLKRRQMAKFIARTIEYVTGAPLPAPSGDYFDDDNGDSAETEFNQLAELGIFQGDGTGNVFPDGNLSRRQMASILTRTLEVLFSNGDIDRLFPAEVTTNQTIPVAPSDEVTQDPATAATRDFTATELAAGQKYRISLFAADHVMVDANGVVTFQSTTGTSGACADVTIADQGSPATTITTVNGNTVSSPDDTVGGVMPVNGAISFTITGSTADAVIPAVFVDNGPGGCTSLELATDGTPSEDFGIGGQTNFVPAESAGGPFDATVDFVSKGADFFVADGVTYRYDGTDNFPSAARPARWRSSRPR